MGRMRQSAFGIVRKETDLDSKEGLLMPKGWYM